MIREKTMKIFTKIGFSFLIACVSILTISSCTNIDTDPTSTPSLQTRPDYSSLQAQPEDPDGTGWPRMITDPRGTVIVYQPQLDSFKNNDLEGRSAVSVTLKDSDEPVFGAVWFKARLDTDLNTRTASISDLKIPRVRFPDATAEQEKKLTEFLEAEIPKWDLTISLERLEATLELAEREQIAAENLKNDPPKIMVVTEPAVLIFIDGEPQLRDVEKTNLKRIINTPFLIALDTKTKDYYLDGGEIWMTAKDVMGPWMETRKVPKEVQALRQPSEEDKAKTEDDRIPKIIIATESSELIVIDGKPEFASAAENEILYATNTDSDVLMEIASQQYFILVSGRWYSSKSLFDGPWTYVPAGDLPESFAKISPESDIGYILAHVAGTQQSQEAVMDAQIPQTSVVKRDDKSLKVEYDGQPKFEKIEDSDMEYAVNTSYSVIKTQNQYYCCHEAVWYEALHPMGPWLVCTNVPDEIYTIPPSNPHYNVKYVYVYDTTPEVVYTGYYPGYMGSYVYGPTIVYGTGWWYRPWWGSYYYPRPVTYGFHVRYNPWSGWGFGFSFGRGPFRVTIGTGGGYGGWWGPGRYRPYPTPYAYGAGFRAGYRAGYRNGHWSAPRPTPYTANRNIYNRGTNVQRNISRGQLARPTQQPRVTPRQQNNVYTDRNGNIHRRTNSGWQQRDGNKWTPSQGTTPKQPAVKQPTQTPKRQPTVRSTPSQLNRANSARQRGTIRTTQSRARTPAPRIRRK
jgi:hypothetical protein